MVRNKKYKDWNANKDPFHMYEFPSCHSLGSPMQKIQDPSEMPPLINVDDVVVFDAPVWASIPVV